MITMALHVVWSSANYVVVIPMTHLPYNEVEATITKCERRVR